MSLKYWKVMFNKTYIANSALCAKEALSWQPPLPAEYKMNFDAAFVKGRTITICILLTLRDLSILNRKILFALRPKRLSKL